MGVRRFKTALGSQVKNYGVGSARGLIFPNATGGTITYAGGYTIHSFTTVGSSNFQIFGY